jgi:hypothetical protein
MSNQKNTELEKTMKNCVTWFTGYEKRSGREDT